MKQTTQKALSAKANKGCDQKLSPIMVEFIAPYTESEAFCAEMNAAKDADWLKKLTQ